MMTTLKQIDTAANSFMANGTKYIIYPDLSFERFVQFEKLQAQIGWNIDFDRMHKALMEVWQLLNKLKLAEASVKINNLMDGIARNIEGREHPAFLVCTLFMCREGEDLTTWSETDAAEKIADWRKEYAVEGFFNYAFSLVKGFIDAYNSRLAGISPMREGEPMPQSSH